jgi:hypothetical protein
MKIVTPADVRTETRLYKAVGTARLPNGEVKVRFCNDHEARLALLPKAGYTEVKFAILDEAKTKVDAVLELLNSNEPEFAGPEEQAAMITYLGKHGIKIETTEAAPEEGVTEETQEEAPLEEIAA